MFCLPSLFLCSVWSSLHMSSRCASTARGADLLRDRRDHGLPGQPLENDRALRSKLQLQPQPLLKGIIIFS